MHRVWRSCSSCAHRQSTVDHHPSASVSSLYIYLSDSTSTGSFLGIRHCACTLIIARDGATSASTSRRGSGASYCPARSKMVRWPRLATAGAPTITLYHSLHSALKEFFDPLRTNDPRTDFFTLYRRESGEFDRYYARKYDDLNTFLIFVSRQISVLGIER